MTHPLLIVSLIGLTTPAFATTGALPAAEALALATKDSRSWCTEQGGSLTLPDSAATAVDLTGDGSADDWIVDEAGAFCAPDFGHLGGSGGSMVHAVIGAQVQSWLAGAWLTQDIAFTVEGETMPPVRSLILGLHGSACNSFGAAPCLLALTWDGERLISHTPFIADAGTAE
ncbi:MAG: hypothetical protein ACK4HF_09300 [Paracoccaceae bacterium]